MRISKSVLRWLSAGICCLVFLLAAPTVVADTGTYGISDYLVTLEPQSSGQVKIIVEQQWEVLSGDIPWITVGLPNNNFSVLSHSGAASKVSAANSSGFSGVRVDLDKDYKAGETFGIRFTVLQNNLLERLTSQKKWRINYTPGWYDRASIDHLQISLVSPVDFQTYSSVVPLQTSVKDNVITWDKFNVSPGGRFNIVVESTDGSFLSATTTNNSQSNPFDWTFVIIFGIFIVLGLLIFWGARKAKQNRIARINKEAGIIEEEMAEDPKKKKEIEEGFKEYVDKKKIEPDEEGQYYDQSQGTYINPAIWAAMIINQQNDNRTGGVSSCACACVACACACACACAGGGAAGCSRKSLHECSKCSVFKDRISKTSA
jgi:hypothetical protein